MVQKSKLIILDRDGVINHDSNSYIKSAEEFIPYKNSLTAIALLKQKGYKVAIATNQSGIGRGFYGLNQLREMHTKLTDKLKKSNTYIDKIEFCPHVAEDNCTCRKPKPGMLLKLFDFFNLSKQDRGNIFFVGDSICDLEAAKAASCKPILVLTGNGKETEKKLEATAQIQIFDDLLAFVNTI